MSTLLAFDRLPTNELRKHSLLFGAWREQRHARGGRDDEAKGCVSSVSALAHSSLGEIDRRAIAYRGR